MQIHEPDADFFHRVLHMPDRVDLETMKLAYPKQTIQALDQTLVEYARGLEGCASLHRIMSVAYDVHGRFPTLSHKCTRYSALMRLYLDDIHRKCSSARAHYNCLAVGLMLPKRPAPHPLDALLPELCVDRFRRFSECEYCMVDRMRER